MSSSLKRGKLDRAFPPIRFPQLDRFRGESEVYYRLHPRPRDTHTHALHLMTLLIERKSIKSHQF